MTARKLGEGRFTFAWDDAWGGRGHHDGGTKGWAHHGIAVTTAGEVVTFHESEPEVMVLDRDGEVLRRWPVELVEGHGMLLVRESDEDVLWISDNGSKNRPTGEGSYVPDRQPVRGHAVKYSLDGREVLRLEMPELPMYAEGDYCPTQVAVDEERFGGSGDIWVADCYGQGVVHRFDRNGRYLATIDGTEGAGRFAHPHAVYLDRRGPQPELYVADRRNKRIQVFDLEGRFLRSFGEDFLQSPSGFAPYGDHLLVGELDSRLVVLGPDDAFVCSIGEYDPSARSRPGWPNAEKDGATVRPPLASGRFNTPHGVAVDRDGSIYVTEWLIGGRLVKLTPTS